MVVSAAVPVTREALCEWPSAARTTAVCEVPPPAGIAPSNAPPTFANPVATNSRLALIDGSVGRAKARPAAIVSVKLISAMPNCARREVHDQRRIGQRERRQSLWNVAHQRDAPIAEPENPGHGDRKRHDHQRRRRMRPQPLQYDQHRKRRRRYGERHRRGLGQMLDYAVEVAEEAGLVDVDAEQLRHLVEHDHQADSRLEAGEHRHRDEVRHETQPEHPSEQKHGADEQRQRRGGRDQLRGVAVGHDHAELSAGENRERCRRTHAQHTRGAEQCVDDHRHQSGVEAHRHWQPGHRGVRHGLGQYDGRGGQARHKVEAQRRRRRAELTEVGMASGLVLGTLSSGQVVHRQPNSPACTAVEDGYCPAAFDQRRVQRLHTDGRDEPGEEDPGQADRNRRVFSRGAPCGTRSP